MKRTFPEGTLSIGLGLVVGGLCQYGFLAIASHALGPGPYSPLATFWSLLFVLGPGFFVPLEQEVGRALAARRALGNGGGPLVARAALAAALVVGGLIAVAGLLSDAIVKRVFLSNSILLIALMVGLTAYASEFLARGTLSGNGRFRPYGLLLGTEGVVRVALCAGLFAFGVRDPSAYGFALVIGSVVAVGVAIVGRRGLLKPGPPAAWSELSSALGFLLVASVMLQFLLSVGPVAVQLLATPAQQADAGRFLTTRVVAFIPIYLFQAVMAALLPKLSNLAATGLWEEFRRLIRRLLMLAAAVGAAATAGLAALGPQATRLLFGTGFELGRLDFALLGASCTGFILAQILGQAVISLKGYSRTALAWTTGAAAFLTLTATGSQLFLRVEAGLVAGAFVSFVMMAAVFASLVRDRAGAPAPERRTVAPAAASDPPHS